MKDIRLKTSYENYEAFDVIADGGWSNREIALAMADFLDGSIGTHERYDAIIREIAECSDDDIGELVSDLEVELSEIILDDAYHAIIWRDNELLIVPALESCLEDHQQDGRVSDELPDVDSTHHCGDTWMTVNDHGNTSLYRFQDTVTGWTKIWAVV